MEPQQYITEGMQLNLRFEAVPALQFIPQGKGAAQNADPQFVLLFDAALSYPSLTRILNGAVGGKRFELTEGLISSHVVLETVEVSGDAAGNLNLQAQFGGSFKGDAFFRGKPVYDTASQQIMVAGLEYELQTGSLLLRMARSLLNNKIKSELQKRTVFPLKPLLFSAKKSIDEMLNKEWASGVRAEGTANEVSITGVQALPDHLLVMGKCTGTLQVNIELKM